MIFRRRAASTLLLLLVGACTNGGPDVSLDDAPNRLAATDADQDLANRTPAPADVGGLQRLAWADAAGVVLRTEGAEIDFLTGINVGSAVPGRLPAELAVDAPTWRRWFEMIGDTGVHAIRIYTVQPPHFYDELLAYNTANPTRPLYLVHGVWIPEDQAAETRDLFDPEVLDQAETDIDDAVAVVHGDATLPERQGYASGTYTSDVSPWLLSWVYGVEMDPNLVVESDAANRGQTYEGRFVTPTEDASPTEVWLARMIDRVASAEAGYGNTMPLSFSNWPTTDPLEHPTEPLTTEDLVGVDANHLRATDQWPGGMYASYHAYPYYPDFQRYEPGIVDYVYRDREDAYAGYLAKLRDHHAEAGLPVMVMEFGVPSSLGSAHSGSLGRDQGGHTEQEAMAINADLLRTQFDLGLSGGFVFAWQDEWFKRTWNTMDTEIPADRRQLWQNPLTNEANFGLVAMDAGEEGPPIIIDGDGADWTTANSQVIHESADHHVREVRATHDESYLYLRLVLNTEVEGEPAKLSAPITVGFDVVPGGNGGLPGSNGAGPDDDTAIVFETDGASFEEANAYIRASNDHNDLTLGVALGFHDVRPAAVAEGSGYWNPQRLNINRPLTVRGAGPGGGDLELPIEWFDLNPLVRGTSDPASDDYDSHTLWAATDDMIETRVPWAIVGLADPSSLAGLVVGPDGSLSTAPVERLGVTVVEGNDAQTTAGYAWEPWNRVTWRERPKAGLQIFVDMVRELTGQ